MTHERHGQGVSQIPNAALLGPSAPLNGQWKRTNFMLLSHQRRLIRLMSNLSRGCGDERTGACQRWTKNHHAKQNVKVNQIVIR